MLAAAALHGAPVTPQQALSIATEARQSIVGPGLGLAASVDVDWPR